MARTAKQIAAFEKMRAMNAGRKASGIKTARKPKVPKFSRGAQVALMQQLLSKHFGKSVSRVTTKRFLAQHPHVAGGNFLDVLAAVGKSLEERNDPSPDLADMKPPSAVETSGAVGPAATSTLG